jgi:hypothetical protein
MPWRYCWKDHLTCPSREPEARRYVLVIGDSAVLPVPNSVLLVYCVTGLLRACLISEKEVYVPVRNTPYRR